MELKELFESIPDYRRGAGKRFPLKAILWMLFLGICCGYTGYRSIAKFMESNEVFFSSEFNLKHGVPSYVTIREILQGLEKTKIKESFNQWSSQASLSKYEWLSGDGQALRSTVISAHDSAQNFIALVSLFCQKTGLVYRMEEFRSKKKDEASIIRLMLADLKDKGIILTLDALHCQKKLYNK